MSLDVKELKTSMNVLFNLGITPLIVGNHGIGKSQIVAQYARENGYGMIDLRIGQMSDAGDLIGLPEFVKDLDSGQIISTQFFAPQYLPRTGKYILFCDEINRGNKEILQALFQLIYDKKMSLNGYELGLEMRIIAAMNPSTEDYDVLDFSDKAFNDRFCQLKFEPSVKDWLSYMREQNYDSFYLDYIADNPKALESDGLQKFNLEVSPSRRAGEMLIRVEKYCKENGVKDGILFELGSGLIGSENMAAYTTAKKNAIKNVTPEDIMNNFKEHKKYIARLSDLDNGKPEIVAKISGDLNEHLVKLADTREITETEWDNVLSYYLETNKEHLAAFLKPLITGLGTKAFFEPNYKKYLEENDKAKKLVAKLKAKHSTKKG
jgi:hypothetical protein